MFKKSISVIALALFVIAFAVVVTGCGGKEEPPPEKTAVKKETRTAKKVTHEEKKATETVKTEPVVEADMKVSTKNIAKPKTEGEQDIQSMKNLDDKTAEVKPVVEEESKKGKMKFKDH